MEPTPQLNEEEFNVFLLLYASFSDYDYSPEEESYIRGISSEDVYNKTLNVFESMSSFMRLQTILDHKESYFSTASQKKKLLSTLENQFKVDGDFSKPEKTTLQFLDKLL